MRLPAQHPTAGRRAVYCTRGDCAGAGDEQLPTMTGGFPFPGANVRWYRCESPIVILDRRDKFGNPCAAFKPKP